MTNNRWYEARLIPTTGIATRGEQELRATAGLLATMTAVEDFGRTLTTPLGAPEGTIETFSRVPFPVGGREFEAHGVIRVGTGSKPWTALVEVSTGSRPLRTARLEQALDVAQEHGIDALLTISNEVAPLAGQHPTSVPKEKLGRVVMLHHPWSQIATEAFARRTACQGDAPAAARILGELVRYLEHPHSGTLRLEISGEDEPGLPGGDPAETGGAPEETLLTDGARPGPAADDAPTNRMPQLAAQPTPTRPSGPAPQAEVPAPRGPVRREIRVALRENAGEQVPDRAGWYRDQTEDDRLRWWDGADWTEHVYDLPPAPRGSAERLQNQAP